MRSKPTPSPLALADFRRECPVERYQDWLFHGTPAEGAFLAMTEGFSGPEHNELGGGCYLSTSRNDNVLSLFSDGEAETGFAFQVDIKAVRLSEFYYALLAHESSADFFDDLAAKDPGVEERAERLGFRIAEGHYGTSGEWLETTLKAMGGEIDGIILPGFESNSPQAEAEMALTPRGCAKLMDAIEYVYVRGTELEKEDGLAILTAMAKKRGWGSFSRPQSPLAVESMAAPDPAIASPGSFAATHVL